MPDTSKTKSVTHLRIALVGPLPPPAGGMANQCRQLARLLEGEGAKVYLVRTNAPIRPSWVAQFPVVRAVFRLLPYIAALWRTVGEVDVVHLFANSGWAWHLFAAPTLVISRARKVPVVVNYRGGNAASFMASAPNYVHRMLRRADALVTPSDFLRDVFAGIGIGATVVPNIIDLVRFKPRPRIDFGRAPHLIVTRNLEEIYDIPTAIRAFAAIRQVYEAATLTIAGTGPQLKILEVLTRELNLAEAVRFSGRIENDSIAELYRTADLLLNPSTVDNMPISILEAFASGVPVVSTNVGGIPHLAKDESSALLVPPRDPNAMAVAALRVLGNPSLALFMVDNGLQRASEYAWDRVRDQWYTIYSRVIASQHRALRQTL